MKMCLNVQHSRTNPAYSCNNCHLAKIITPFPATLYPTSGIGLSGPVASLYFVVSSVVTPTLILRQENSFNETILKLSVFSCPVCVLSPSNCITQTSRLVVASSTMVSCFLASFLSALSHSIKYMKEQEENHRSETQCRHS